MVRHGRRLWWMALKRGLRRGNLSRPSYARNKIFFCFTELLLKKYVATLILMSKKIIKRRAFLKFSGLSTLVYWLSPLQKAVAFSAARMRRRRGLVPGPLRVSQFLISALVLDDSKTLRSSQVLQSVLARDESQTLRSSQTLLIVLVAT